jgi:hypothetical protein
MPIDSKAKAFIEANIEHYREVTLAVRTFETEVETALRSIWREFKQQLSMIGIPEDDASFKVQTGDDESEMYLKTGWNTGIQIGIALQCRDDDDKAGRFAVYSWVWVKDTDLRKSLDNRVATHLSAPFVHEFVSSTTYITAYLDLEKKPQAIDLLRDGFTTLLECLFGSPEFCKSYNVTGPVGTGGDHR